MTTPIFHLAIPVHDLAAARAFYGGVLGCAEGRSSDAWVDFNFRGHQLVAHLDTHRLDTHRVEGTPTDRVAVRNHVDGDGVPVPHFGLILPRADWEALVERLRAANVRFEIEPRVRFAGQPGEQGTFFVFDPSGNALEFKWFDDPSRIFRR
jgi:extradiol dioxygenase family protein